MAVKRNDDGTVIIDRMKPCPFCGQPVAIGYSKQTQMFTVIHVKYNGECPMQYGVEYKSDGVINFYEAVEKWNRRASDV